MPAMNSRSNNLACFNGKGGASCQVETCCFIALTAALTLVEHNKKEAHFFYENKTPVISETGKKILSKGVRVPSCSLL